MKNHVMLDLETMGNDSDAAIVSIGACAFNPTGENVPEPDYDSTISNDVFYRRVNLESSLKAGLTINGETIYWWLKQSEKARRELTKHTVSLSSALSDFSAWWNYGRYTYLWSHGATFDAVILTTAFKKLGYLVPWSYKNIRDTRTLFDIMFLNRKTKHQICEQSHTALFDAWRQALDVQWCYRTLKDYNIY